MSRTISLIIGFTLAALLASPAFGQTVLLDFYTDGCIPCAEMTPVVDQMTAEGYEVQRINAGANRNLAAQYGVDRYPTFIVLEKGREVDRIVGKTTSQRLKVRMVRKTGPTRAWRRVRATGRYAAVVRVHCCNGRGEWSKGSGVLVRWGKRIVVLTAKHVVEDARTVLVDFCTGKRHRARIIKVDSRWDCAVLDIGDKPVGIEPAELAFGDDAKFAAGDRLETCGYGPDSTLYANSGLFKGYRSWTDDPKAPDDWMAISGKARGGDSGGPVFDDQGRVAGIIWGCKGDVTCVQPGRLHAALSELKRNVLVYERPLQRPTPPAEEQLVPVNWKQPSVSETGFANQARDPMLKWRRDAEAKDRAIMQRLERQSDMLDAVSRQKPNRPSTNVDVAIERPAEKQKPANERSPLLGGLVVMASIAGGCFIYFGAMKG